LYKGDAIRWEWYESKKSNRTRIFIFQCVCGNEIRTKTSRFKKHSGLCLSCSAKKTIKKAQKANRLRPYEAKYNIFVSKCPETDLAYEDYLKFVGKNCTYCKVTLPWEPFGENNPGFWLDRMDNNKGHIKGNLVTCCGTCNLTKRGHFSYAEFMLLAPILEKIRIQREIDCVSGSCEL